MEEEVLVFTNQVSQQCHKQPPFYQFLSYTDVNSIGKRKIMPSNRSFLGWTTHSNTFTSHRKCNMVQQIVYKKFKWRAHFLPIENCVKKMAIDEPASRPGWPNGHYLVHTTWQELRSEKDFYLLVGAGGLGELQLAVLSRRLHGQPLHSALQKLHTLAIISSPANPKGFHGHRGAAERHAAGCAHGGAAAAGHCRRRPLHGRCCHRPRWCHSRHRQCRNRWGPRLNFVVQLRAPSQALVAKGASPIANPSHKQMRRKPRQGRARL